MTDLSMHQGNLTVPFQCSKVLPQQYSLNRIFMCTGTDVSFPLPAHTSISSGGILLIAKQMLGTFLFSAETLLFKQRTSVLLAMFIGGY